MESNETVKKEKKPSANAVLKKRVDELQNLIDTELAEIKRRFDSIPDLLAKVEALESNIANTNVDSVKSRLFDVEESTKRVVSGFEQKLNEFSESFEKFKSVWKHNEEGLSVNDYFQGQNVEKPFIHGGVPVDEEGKPLEKKPKSKLQEHMIGDLPVLQVP